MKRSWQFRWRAIGMRTPRKLTSTCRFQQQERGPYQVDGPLAAAQATSKRSWSITLVHAATKSFANFSFESAHA